VDAGLVALVLVFAFAAASFVARNSDVWLHLAAGQRLFAGQYTPGTDPFSYTAADRAWVNHSWLTDAVAYLLYGGDGKVLVIAKALLVALTFGLVIAVRRPGQALWAWAGVAAVAVLAAAPQFALRPLVVSMAFLAATLFLLFRLPHRAHSWRFPAAVGVTFWLWANADEWFFLGPLALALVLVGELVQRELLKPSADPADPAGDTGAPADDAPLGRVPDLATLVKALGVGVLACTLTPHHVRVWELPFELVGASGLNADPRFKVLGLAPYADDYLTPAFGGNQNGLAYAVLLVAGAVVLGFGRVRAAHVTLWVGFAALSLLSVSAVPFFAVVAVPLVAAQLAAAGARVELRGADDPRSRALLVGASAGRLACVVAALALCVAAYPGWVHPESTPPVPKRFAWGVEPEPALTRAADQFRRWRETGELAADARGVVAQIDLANYLAWFAPAEKVFVNARYNHHRPELADYVRVRQAAGLLPAEGERPNPAAAAEVLARAGAEYLALHVTQGEVTQRSRSVDAPALLYQRWAEWSPWYADGRTTVFGWHQAGTPVRPSFAALRVDPAALAFGPGVQPVPAPGLSRPVQLGWEAAFVRPPKPAPPGAAEAFGWLRFREGPLVRQRQREVISDALLVVCTMDHPLRYLAARTALLGTPPLPLFDPGRDRDLAALQAAPLLALRAARRAVAENPDHPDAYFALAQALTDPNLPLTDGERALGRITALRQCLDRFPRPEDYRRGQFAASPVDAAYQLSRLYLGENPLTPTAARRQTVRWYTGVPLDVYPLNVMLGRVLFEKRDGSNVDVVRVQMGQAAQYQAAAQTRPISGNAPLVLSLDLGHEALKQAVEYAAAEAAGRADEQTQIALRELETLRGYAEGALTMAHEKYDPYKQRGGVPVEGLVAVALDLGLAGEAMSLLVSREPEELKKEYKERALQAWLLRICLQLATGQVEGATFDIEALRAAPAPEGFERSGVGPWLTELEYQARLQAGDYRKAGEVRERAEGAVVGRLAKMPPLGPEIPIDLLLRAVAAAKQTNSPGQAIDAMFGRAPLMPNHPLLRTLMLGLWTDEWLILGDTLRQSVAKQLQQESQYCYRRGALALLEGDVETARERFRQARREPPPGWQLRPVDPPAAANYLRLIEQANPPRLAP
jgi:hypothetical protein